jgi:hypothetical protein
MTKGGVFLAVMFGALVAPATAWAGGSSPAPATLAVAITSPVDGDLYRAPATVAIKGTASISGGWSYDKAGWGGSSTTPKLTSLDVAIDGTARPISNADIDPDLPRSSPATVKFFPMVSGLGVGSHQICVTARSTSRGVKPATDCVRVEVVEDLVECTDRCELFATDPGVATAELVGIGIEKLVGLRVGELVPGECGGQDCLTRFDVLFDGDDGGGIAELTVITAKPPSTPPGDAAVFIDRVQVTAKCTGSGASPLPCQKINRTRSGQTIYFVRFAADPGISFR